MLDDPLLLAFTLVLVGLAAWVHGFIGIGFPLISTPSLAAVTDLKTAVVLTVIPNIALNILSILRGGNLGASLLPHWRLPVYVLLGSLVGTHFLIGVPGAPLKVLLALMMLVSVAMNRIKGFDWGFIRRAPRIWEAVAGLTGGLLAGTVNISVPPLAIYFMALGLSPIATIQIFNLCFIVGKLTQAGSLAAAGEIHWADMPGNLALTVLAVLALLVGMRLQARTSPAQYRQWLNVSLAVMAVLLLGQVAWQTFSH